MSQYPQPQASAPDSRMSAVEMSPPPSPPSLSVIIPSYNALQCLIPCLRSMITTGMEAGRAGRLQLIVQDDCSDQFDVMECVGLPIEAERNAVNLGFAGNCNAGAKRAKGDVLFFLNQDTRALNDWFAPLMSMFDDPNVGIVGPKLVSKFGGEEYSIQSCILTTSA